MPVYSDGWSDTFGKAGVYLTVTREGQTVTAKLDEWIARSSPKELGPELLVAIALCNNAIARRLGEMNSPDPLPKPRKWFQPEEAALWLNQADRPG